MVLTPSDVQQKTFGPELRGYNMDEVDDFLDEIVATLTEYERRLAAASDKARRSGAQGVPPTGADAPAGTPTVPGVKDESIISRTLVTAQQTADSLLEKAQVEADSLLARASADADDLKAGALAERERTIGEIERIRSSVGDLRTRLSGLTRSVDEDLLAMEKAIDDGTADFDTGSRTDEEDVADAPPPVATEPVEPVESVETTEETTEETTDEPGSGGDEWGDLADDDAEDDDAEDDDAEEDLLTEEPEETMVIDPEEERPHNSELAPGDDDAFGEFDPWGDTAEQEQMDLEIDEDSDPRRPWER